MRNAGFLIVFLGLSLCVRNVGFAQEKITVDLVKEKVYAAAKLVSQDGAAAFPKLQDPNGEFRFGGGEGYIWVHSMSGFMLMHPTKSSLVGMNQLDLQDSTEFPFIAAMNQLVEKHNEGWVIYLWPKPGQVPESTKLSFVKLAVNQGKKYVIGCGVYDITKSDIVAAYPKDIIYDKNTPLEEN